MNDHVNDLLKKYYNQAMERSSGKDSPATTLPQSVTAHIDVIVRHAENSKAVLTVIFTSLVYKILHPSQDVRLHQSSIEGGYSGRTFDTTYITPFLKSCRFPSMSESGWLTRSLEQKVPYDYHYTGAITPSLLKEAFLETMHNMETCEIKDVENMLDYLLQSLIILRDSKSIALAKPRNLSIDGIVRLLDLHFHSHYKSFGASRLPVLAIYAIYQSLFADGFKRFDDKHLLSLEKHTSADVRSGRIGDIDIVNDDNSAFEAVEVKFDIPITHNIVVIAKEKIQPSSVQRYYILSTSEIAANEKEKIEDDIQQIKNTHGCQLIVNGIIPTLKYYLRLLENTSVFIDNYTMLMGDDSTVKFEQKQRWNELVSEM